MNDQDSTRAPATDAPTAAGPPQTPAEEIPQLIDHLRAAVLRRMVLMMTEIPTGYYTEIKGEITNGPGVGTWKMRDFAASLKDLAAIGPKGGGEGPDVESWEPLKDLLDGKPYVEDETDD